MIRLQENNFSLKQVKRDQKFVRNIFGEKSVESRSEQKVIDATHHLDQFFEVKEMVFTQKVGKGDTKKVVKPVVVVKKVNG